MRRLAFTAVAAVALLAGCTAPVAPALPVVPGAPTPTASPSSGAMRPVGTPTLLASGLEAPWSILRLGEDDSTLISERDSGAIKELTPDGTLRQAGSVEGVAASGEGGLLGLEKLTVGEITYVYAYFTSDSDNRIVRMRLEGEAGSYSFGAAELILSGLAKAGNHDGGRIKFGPDGMLYATVGDAAQPDRAQDPDSLNGKILRMTPTGEVPDDNPAAGSLVYSSGHRNPQGIAWNDEGQLFAAEFGQNSWDEFNLISAGLNYGWPVVEGVGGRTGFVDPLAQWSTSEASPSGLAYVRGTFFMASLRGERLWAIQSGGTGVPAASTAYFAGEFGRLRDVTAGPDGTLWMLTNNTDGRGDPEQGDDRLLQVELAPVD